MDSRIVSLLAMLALGASACAGTPEQAAAARAAYEKALEAWSLKLKLAESDAVRHEIAGQRPSPRQAAERMWSVIGRDLSEPWTLGPAAWFLRLTRGVVEGEGDARKLVFAEEMETVRDAVAEHHLTSEGLAPMCMALVALGGGESRALLERIEQEHPAPEISGVAALGLAMMAKDLGDEPRVMRERLSLLRQAIIDAADVKVGEVTVAELAEEELYIIMNLSKGRQAPELEGVDSGGRPMKLSDHAGKVVMLVFWNSRGEAEEVIRLIGEIRSDPRFAGGDFEVVGVNNDPRTVLRELQAEGRVDWPNFSDPENVLGEIYRVGVRPLAYVLGRDRTIHYIGGLGTFAELTAAAVLQEE